MYPIKYTLIFIVTCCFTFGYSQTSNKFNFQMLIRNAQEEPHADKQITVDVSLFSDDNGSLLFYKERHTLITDFMGVASMVIGEGTLLSGNLSISPRFLKMEVDPEGGTNFSINFSEKLSSVPFSQFSQISLKIPPKSVEVVNIAPGTLPLSKLGFPYVTADNLNSISQSLTTAGNKNYHIKSNGTCTFGSVTDKEGNTYKTITIGTQEWMAENLRAGGGFPQVSSSSDWSNLQQPAWSYYDNNPTYNNSFGKLYNGFAVNQYKNLCPTGWHIPNDFEWSILSKTLGGDNVSGGALKSINSTFWVNPNVGATNASCFSSIPNGYREADGIFKDKGSSAVYFQSDFSVLPLFRNLITEESTNFRLVPKNISTINKVGAAVRCLKGDSVGIYSPLVNLDSITQISPNSSRVYANVQDGGSQVLETGIVWSTVGIPSINGNKLSTSTAKLGNYDVNLTGLLPTTKYYVRAFAVNQIGVSYSSLDSFMTTNQINLPKVNTSNLGAIFATNTLCGGEVTSDGGSPVTARGVVWSTSPNPSIALATKTMNGSGTGVFTSNAMGLIPNTEYYIRAYATNSTGTDYGEERTFITLPQLTTTSVTEITNISANTGGNIIPAGSATITARGVVWSTSPNPTIALSTKTTDGAGTGVFPSNLSGLAPNTTYYIKGYATNATGTGYGEEITFITLPNITTTAITDVTENAAKSGGNITPVGNATITARGVVWSTSPNPSIALSTKTVDGTGTGAFPSNLTGLAPNTTYYIKAYATNAMGTGYGEERTFITLPQLTTTSVTEITNISANTGGNIIPAGSATITARGVVWSTSPNPTIALSTKTTDGAGTGVFPSNLSGLAPNTTYYIKGYATNATGTGYGEEITFITLPNITTTAITDVTENAAKSGGNITPVGNATITARGVVWSTSPNPTIALSTKTTDGPGTGAFPSNLTGLTSNTTYYVKAYATNSSGTGYGNEVSFKTNIIQVFPIVNTSIPINVESNKALAGGFVNSEGTSPVTVRGIIWSTTPLAKETGKDRTMVPGGGTGAFTSLLTGLKPDTWYYTVAYATSSVGTSYGGEISFKTKPASIPEVTTLKCSEIKEKTLMSGGNVTADGGDTISARGVVWSTNPAPTLSMNVPFKTDPVKDKGEYMINLSELTPNTRYYVRAYATNSAGTGYGLPESCVTLPLLATTALSAVWEDTAKSGGTFTPEGNADITAKGVVWSTNPNPTIALSTKTVDGTGTGVFTSNLKGLTPNTIYYVKAYATNATGTGYGNELTFTTLPKLTTTGVSEKMENTAKSGGNISPAGNAPITARGVVWSTSPKPTIALSTKTEDGMGTGVFTSSITGLTAKTTYYLRAYATNGAGTNYGNELSFIAEKDTFSCVGTPTVTDIDNNTYKTVQIGTQCWMQSNLKVSKYRNGEAIPTGLSDSDWQYTHKGAYAINENNNANDAIYGKLYNWYAVKDVKGLCPTGWHVPTKDEWDKLVSHLGGQVVAGGKMKSTTGWPPYSGTTNESGFTGLPGGVRIFIGRFGRPGSSGVWWSSSEAEIPPNCGVCLTGLASIMGLGSNNVVSRNNDNKESGLSVRCLRD